MDAALRLPFLCCIILTSLIFGRKLIGVVLALAFAPAPAMAFKFSDKFNPPSSAWSDTSGNWTASGGDYYAQQPNNNPEVLSYLPYVFNDVSDRLTVTVNNLGDGGILFLAPEGKNYLLSVIGGSNYGQGSRGGDAGNSAYWATAADPSATFNLVTGVFSPGRHTRSPSKSMTELSPSIRGRPN